MIDSAQQGWGEIKDLGSLYPLSKFSVCDKQEKLKNLLEDIRGSIEDLLLYSHCKMLVDVCKKFLESIFGISEGLRASYAFPGYVESFYILDTMKVVDGLMMRKSWAGGISFSFFYLFSTNLPFSRWITWSAKRRIVGSCSIIRIVSHFSRKDLRTHNNLEISSGWSQTVGSSRKYTQCHL